MKAILEFNLNEPEDVMAHKRCVKSVDMAVALFQISTQLIDRLRHLEEIAEETELNLVDFVVGEITSTMEENGIILDELIN
jgi:hypothetical protein